MALEPYRPEPKYRDDLEREIDKKIDSFFHRWNWKLVRFITRAAVVLFVLWLLINLVPSAIEFVSASDLAPQIVQLVMTGISLFFFIGFQFFLMYFFMARSRIYWVLPGETGVSFKDYKGNPEVMEAARRIVTLLQGVKSFKDMGGEATRGVLLIGPPGTGKSYLAQAISTEAGVPFGYLSAPSLTSAWMGMGNIKVMNLYRKARRLAREYGACILFIDEIDAIGGARSSSLMGGAGGAFGRDGAGLPTMPGALGAETGGVRAAMGLGMGMNAGSGLLNELLLQMDPPPQEVSWWGKLLRHLGLRKGKAEMPPVLTMGATNLAESLDAALLRPGRFDRKISIDKPDADGRKEILEYYLSKVKHEPMPYDRMVSDTIGYTPVAIKFVINEAVIHAHFDNRQAINYWDFTHAREMHEWGLKQPIRGLPYEERRATAYHEAGHAYVQAKLITRERIAKVTIVRHGRAAGFVAPKPLDEHHIPNKKEMLDDIKVTLAAYAAEEIFLGGTTAGVSMDMAQATHTAALMSGYVAMDGSFFSYAAFGGAPGPELKPRIEAILNEQHRIVKALLEANKEAVIAIAEALILRNELTDIDVNEILARVEAEHPFVDPQRAREVRPFGFLAARELPEPQGRRAARPSGAPAVLPPVAQQPAPDAPAGPVADAEGPRQ